MPSTKGVSDVLAASASEKLALLAALQQGRAMPQDGPSALADCAGYGSAPAMTLGATLPPDMRASADG